MGIDCAVYGSNNLWNRWFVARSRRVLNDEIPVSEDDELPYVTCHDIHE